MTISSITHTCSVNLIVFHREYLSQAVCLQDYQRDKWKGIWSGRIKDIGFYIRLQSLVLGQITDHLRTEPDNMILPWLGEGRE